MVKRLRIQRNGYCECRGDGYESIVKAAVDQALNAPIIVADRFHFVRYIYWALDRVRRRVQNIFDDYDRKKCKRMRHVFMKRSHTLTEKQTWYLHHYCDKSELLTDAYLIKEWFCDWLIRLRI